MNIYKESLLHHYHNTANRGHIENADFTSRQHNPSCGDSVVFQGIIEDTIAKKIVFEGKGCVISQAAASILVQNTVGKSIPEILALDTAVMVKSLGIELGPMRLKCALLPLQALQEGINSFLASKKGENAGLCQGTTGFKGVAG